MSKTIVKTISQQVKKFLKKNSIAIACVDDDEKTLQIYQLECLAEYREEQDLLIFHSPL